MRATLDLDAEVLAQAKRAAQETGVTLTAFVEDALRERLARMNAARAMGPVRLPTNRGRGLRPGLDLDNSENLRDIMDGLA